MRLAKECQLPAIIASSADPQDIAINIRIPTLKNRAVSALCDDRVLIWDRLVSRIMVYGVQ